jgi:LemA protein
MESIVNFFVSVFWILLIVSIILVIWIVRTYNELRGLREEVREKRSNVRAAVKKMVDIINKASEVVKGYKGFEQVTQLKVSQDNSTSALMSTVQQSSTMMATLQGATQRFPELKSSELYKDLMNDVRSSHANIEEMGQKYNEAVKNYNSVALRFPAIFFGKFVGYTREEYLSFDTQGMEEHVGTLQSFESDDEERVHQLLQTAGTRIFDTTKRLSHQAGAAGKKLAAKIKEHANVSYFYMKPGGVPKGPESIEMIQAKIDRGELDDDIMLAKSGTDDWMPLDAVFLQLSGQTPAMAPKPQPPRDNLNDTDNQHLNT